MSADLEDSTEFKENGSDGSEPAHPEVVFWGANGRPMFNLFSVLISVLLWGGVSSAEQGGAVFTEHHVKVTVAMEGEGFMCPFLTPQFIDFLKVAGQPVQGPWPPHQEPRPDPDADSLPTALPDDGGK